MKFSYQKFSYIPNHFLIFSYNIISLYFIVGIMERNCKVGEVQRHCLGSRVMIYLRKRMRKGFVYRLSLMLHQLLILPSLIYERVNPLDCHTVINMFLLPRHQIQLILEMKGSDLLV